MLDSDFIIIITLGGAGIAQQTRGYGWEQTTVFLTVKSSLCRLPAVPSKGRICYEV